MSSSIDHSLLKQTCLHDPSDKSARSAFIAYYENSLRMKREAQADEDDHLVYLKLKSLYGEERWRHLSDIGRIYLDSAKPRLAFMCLSESLRQNPEQAEIFEIVKGLAPTHCGRTCLQTADSSCTVSVIMPTYRRSTSIGEGIRSVMNQTFKDIELIVINDGGDDNAKLVIDSFGSRNIRYYKFTVNKGLSAALNEGIKKARGRYIAYLDDDDVYYADHLETLVRAIEGTSYDVVYSNAWWCTGERRDSEFIEASRSLYDIRPEKYAKNSLFRNNYISTLNMLHKRDCFITTGLFNEELAQLMDWDMWMRFAGKYRFLQVNKVTGEYRWHKDNMTRRNYLENTFLTTLVRSYHEFACGKIGLLKGYLHEGDLTAVKRLYDRLLNDYDCGPRSSASAAELFSISEHLSERAWPPKILRDYFEYDSRRCVAQLLKKGSTGGLLAVSDLMVSRAFKRIKSMSRKAFPAGK